MEGGWSYAECVVGTTTTSRAEMFGIPHRNRKRTPHTSTLQSLGTLDPISIPIELTDLISI